MNDQELQVRLIRIENKLDNLVSSQCKTFEELTAQGKRIRATEDQLLLNNERSENVHRNLEGRIVRMEASLPKLEEQVESAGNRLTDRLWASFNTIAVFAVGLFMSDVFK